MKGVQLLHDVLDAQLVDRRSQKMGRVDGVVLELRDGQPPRVSELLAGGSIASERIGRWMVALTRVAAKLLRIDVAVTRIPFERVRVIGPCVQVDVDAGDTNAMRSERWLDRIVCRTPGGAGKERK